MKRIIITFILVFFLTPAVSFADLPVPVISSLTATQESITIEWEAIDDEEADGIYVHYGIDNSTGSFNRLTQFPFSEQLSAIIILELNPDTTYYVKLTTYAGDEESDFSVIESVTTSAEGAPETPEGFKIISVSETTISCQWTENADGNPEVDKYIMKYYADGYSSSTHTDNSTSVSSNMITGLDSNTRYYIQIAARNSDGISAFSEELIVDTYIVGGNRDEIAPIAPIVSVPRASGNNQVTVGFDGSSNNEMFDIEGYKAYIRAENGSYASTYTSKIIFDEGSRSSFVFSNLTVGEIYYFIITAFDEHGNENEVTEVTEVSIIIESAQTSLADSDKIEGGCFISSVEKKSGHRSFFTAIFMGLLFVSACCMAACRSKMTCLAIAMVLISSSVAFSGENKMIGFKVGYFAPSDEVFEDYYVDEDLHLFLFYEQKVSKHFSVDLEVGYTKRSGLALTEESREATTIDTEMTLIPILSSVKWNMEITPLITVFVGVGFDYWYYKEKSDTGIYDASDDGKYGVGGYHGKGGLLLQTADVELFQNAGVMMEVVYSNIDRFGNNEIDLGGWLVHAGLFYKF